MNLQHYPTINGRKIRVGVVGCGRISKNHFGSIEQHAQNIELVAVCDIDLNVLKENAEQYKVPGYIHMRSRRWWTWSS